MPPLVIERAALHLLDLQTTLARALAVIGDRLFDPGDRKPVGVADDRHDEPLVRADRDAEVIVIFVDDLGAVDLGIDGGHLP